MYSEMNQNLKKIKEIYNTLKKSSLVCLEGAKGLGKTTVIEEFLEEVSECIQIMNYDEHNYLSPIINGIIRYYRNHGIKLHEQLSDSELTYEEIILEKLLDICELQKCCIILHNFMQFSEASIDFFGHIISTILRRKYKCLIIIEIDTDDFFSRSKLQKLYRFPNQEHIIFHDVDATEIENVLLRENSPLEIDKNSLAYIVSSANKNPALLNIIINYLKSNELIQFNGDAYHCKTLKAGMLSNVLQDDLCSRFDRLSENMKNAFLKSSMIGMEFYANQLSGSFAIISVNETLKQIERITDLLHQKDENVDLYTFANDEIYNFAKSMISEQEKIEWACILFNYYQALWKDYKYQSAQKDHALKAAIYALECGRYEDSYGMYISSFYAFYKINNFRQAISIMEELNKFPVRIQIDPIVQMHLKELEAMCYENIGDYPRACTIYTQCIKDYEQVPYFDIFYIRYRLAYCTYYSSQVTHAYELAEKLWQDLEKNIDRTDSLYYKLASLLATIYREKSIKNPLQMYLLAIEECRKKNFEHEYYVQLRKADLCYEVDMSIPMIRCAAGYFYKNHYIKEYAKAVLNLGTDYLYIGDSIKAKRNFVRSQSVFSDFGSLDEVYAIDCLGVWNATFYMDFDKALLLFLEGVSMNINDFKQMTLYANIAACYQKKKLFDKCLWAIQQCERIPDKNNNKKIAFYQRTILFAWAFYYMELEEYDKSLATFRECFKIPLKTDQKFMAAACAVKLCKILDCKPLEEELKYSNISHSKLYEQYMNLGTLFHTLRFIE